MAVESLEFKAEVKQLLDLMVHSLYSHKEIFLRELISNASDAIDKARYESLTNGDILEGDGEWKIKITADKDAGTLTIHDNGIGMTREEIIEALGTIAHSGTQDFIKALREKETKNDPGLIGQFGVGFYSSFMIADKVTVLSRKAGRKDKKGVKWESSSDGAFTVEDIEKADKGTDIILHIKKEEKKYLNEEEIRDIVKRYSDYIEHPIVMEVEREKESAIEKGQKYTVREEERLNSGKAIWLKPKSEVSQDEYNEFYKHISGDFSEPAGVIHYRAEGTSEFTALLYIPSMAPINILYKDYKIGPALYVKRVRIMDHCEDLLPVYLRFVKGVVDSSDLPLNVSRELLQNNKHIAVIRKNITKLVLDTIADMQKNDPAKYLNFYREFGRVLKEGIHFDFSRREQIADLLLFESTKKEPGEYVSLQEYVDNMKEGQEDIYYITGASRNEIITSPYLEAFKEKDYEVLIMLDEIDDIIMTGLGIYKGKKLKSAVKGDLDLDKSGEDDKKKARKEYEKLIELITNRLKDDVKEVRLSGRLKDSACCLVADEGGMDPQMEKLMKAMGQDIPAAKRILEINPSHPVIETMNALFEDNKSSHLLEEFTDLLYNQALLLEGSKPKDPAAFAKAVADLMVDKTKHLQA
ncbi:MAG: molecular chaperone HtpG [Nitrospirota bacterium]|nr:molecular chaperone HtpG [Nitrospirota bacterium]